MRKTPVLGFLSEASFYFPDDTIRSSWLSHAPFVFWLFETLCPRTFVDIGSHFGSSYFAVCRAVEKLALPTNCYAVDTWQGDQPAGAFGDDAFADVVTRNRKYAKFSTLIRSASDKAAGRFSNKAIDLLHIDGRHFYDDARQDFEVWRLKMSDAGIVLFHDVRVRESGGLWRLFDELKATHPSFEFRHGQGLGVLSVGDVPLALEPLFGADDTTTQSVRIAYSSLGDNIQKKFERDDLAKALAESEKKLSIMIERHEELTRWLSQQRRPEPLSDLPAQLRRRNPFAARNADYKDLVQDYESLASSPLFDSEWYVGRYPNVVEQGEDPVHHYLKYGGTYSMSAGPHFDSHWYLERNPDVRQRGVNPLLHFMREGAADRLSLGVDLDVDAAFEALKNPDASADHTYDRWVRDCDMLSDDDRQAILRHVEHFVDKPLISVVMPIYNTPEPLLEAAIRSVLDQLYPHWELCIADDASPEPQVERVLRRYESDKRVKWVRRPRNGHISAATNSALALASGEFVAFMDHDDVLAAHALYEVAHVINQHPDVDLIYSDEDHIDGAGRRSNPHFKTDWNRELLLCQNMVNHLAVYRRELVDRLGGMREGFEGSQDYDLVLRVGDATSSDRIRHIPAVLYHWRQATEAMSFSEQYLDRCTEAARRAVQESLDRNGEQARVVLQDKEHGWKRVCRPVPADPPLVSLIVPTKDMADITARCIEGVLHRTDYPNLEVIVVDHESREASAIALFSTLQQDPRVRVVPFVGPFNYSAINNAAVRCARGSLIGLINNDIDVIGADWLSEMVSLAVLPETGAVGARLLYGDGRVQHCGVVAGMNGDDAVAGHFCKFRDRADPGYFGRAMLTSSVSAVTAACLVVRKSVFDEVGGLDETLAVAFNDVDFCLKIRERGYRNIFTPHAELYHLESASRGSDRRPDRRAAFRAEISHVKDKWGWVLEHDPFSNPNFAATTENFALAFPTRRRKPWEAYR